MSQARWPQVGTGATSDQGGSAPGDAGWREVARGDARWREVAHLVGAVVLHPFSGHGGLSRALGLGLGHETVDELREELGDLRLAQLVRPLDHDLAEHQIAAHVLDRVVDTAARTGGHPLDEGADLAHRRVGHFDEGLAVERVDHAVLRGGVTPLATHEVPTDGRRGGAHRKRVHRGPRGHRRHPAQAKRCAQA